MNHLFHKLWKLSPQLVVHKLLPKLAIMFDPIGYFDNVGVINDIIGNTELERLKRLPRYVSTTTKLYGKTINIVDAASYLCMLHEIFIKQNYLFKSRTETPLIIDCGANIGLSIIFFNLLYPDSTIIGFEPDPTIYKVLCDNVESAGIKNIELHNKAVLDKFSTVVFNVEGSWGGRILDSKVMENSATIEVETVQLKKIISGKEIDLLKIDVEGAETDIIIDCCNELANVENLFFEYHSFVGIQQKLHDLLKILVENGFKYHIKEATPRRMPFVGLTGDGMDQQLDVFAYKV